MADGARSGVLGFLAPERVEFTDVHVGRGGSGIVTRGWLKVDAERRIAVAIKALAPGATDREIRQFQKEFTISWNASQRCPGACVIYGCCHRGTDLCLVMKLYTGGSLHEMLDGRRDRRDESRREPLPLRQVVAMAMQLAQALAQLHAEKVVCNDLKPGNVLIDEDGTLVIADFGLAVVLERTIMRATTSRADGAGTAAYMAPEQHDSETFGSVSCKTDIWALGCIISEMLSGDVPWAGKRLPEIMMNVAMKKKHPPIPDGPAELQAALRGCFVHKQAERFSAEDLMAALKPLVSVQPAGGGGQAAGDMQTLRVEFETQLSAQRALITQLQAVNAQLQGQVVALTQQMADQAVQTQRQIADAQKQIQQQADQKLANLSRQLQEDMERRIVEHAADAPVAPGLSAATAGWLQELDQELQRQQQMAPQPEPQQHQPRSVVLAAQSATAAAGGVDPLQAEMEKHGLTSSDRAVLFQGGVTTLRTFHLIQDEDFAAYGIDIVARRAAKEVRDLLQREGGDISAAGQAATVQGAGTMAQLCALDLAAMQQLGLGIVDSRFLANLLETSPTLVAVRRRQQQQQRQQQQRRGFLHLC